MTGVPDLGQIRASEARTGYVGKLRRKTLIAGATEDGGEAAAAGAAGRPSCCAWRMAMAGRSGSKRTLEANSSWEAAAAGAAGGQGAQGAGVR